MLSGMIQAAIGNCSREGRQLQAPPEDGLQIQKATITQVKHIGGDTKTIEGDTKRNAGDVLIWPEINWQNKREAGNAG